jgi:hypothetical protein
LRVEGRKVDELIHGVDGLDPVLDGLSDSHASLVNATIGNGIALGLDISECSIRSCNGAGGEGEDDGDG